MNKGLVISSATIILSSNSFAMSLMAASSSSTSSSLPHVSRYDVFSSFHGADVRIGFLSHLHNVFAKKEITMFDDKKMERGSSIRSKLVQAIREAKVSIVLLSKNYASSIWCLDELLEILKCKEASGQIVIPIFYDVDPWHVRRQKGDFGIAFEKTCEGLSEEQKQRWVLALTRVANIAGEHNWTDEATMLEIFSIDVLNKLKKLKEDFMIRDVDQNNFTTAPEPQHLSTREEEVHKIIKAADVNVDGRISKEKFVKFVNPS